MITGLIIGLIIGTISGYAICAMMVIAKDADKMIEVMDADCSPKNCKSNCKAWILCDNKWTVSDEN
jgi:hypothetical protein